MHPLLVHGRHAGHGGCLNRKVSRRQSPRARGWLLRSHVSEELWKAQKSRFHKYLGKAHRSQGPGGEGAPVNHVN